MKPTDNMPILYQNIMSGMTPPDLTAFLRQIGLDRPALDPLPPDALRAVRDGISAQWKPARAGDEPPF
jgi:hypothetical protein